MKTNSDNWSLAPFNRILFAVMAIVFVLGVQNGNAQNGIRSSDIKVLGTSNVHNWTMDAQSTTVNAKFDVKPGTTQITGVSALSFSMPVKGLKSDKDLMNSRTYTALKADKYDKITFNMSSASVTPQANNRYLVKVTGNMTIAGTTKSVTLVANGVVNSDKTISITGSQKFNMSNFGVTPPSFMFGAMKVGDQVTIEYNLKFNG